MNVRNFLKAGLMVAALLGLSACGSDDDGHNLAEVAQERGFNALSAAVAKAGIGDTLTDPDVQLTVFAPTDQAFTDLAKRLGFADASAMVDALPSGALQNILSYHILGARKWAADLGAEGATQETTYSYADTPASLALDFTDGVTITDAVLTSARVVTPDVHASNGVIHAIDKVLVPPGVLNVVQMAQANPLFDSLVRAVVAADLQGVLSGAGPFTVFAPTNAAFAAAPQNLSTPQLRTVLTYHVLGSQVLSSDIPFGKPVATVATQSITIEAGTPPTIRDTTRTPANIVAVDIRASNGVIHVLDKVLIPAL